MSLKKVIVAMSSGVDSSFCVYVLQKAGYQVSGLTMRLGDESQVITKAKKVAKTLGVKHEVIDVREIFKSKITDYFSAEYMRARTPNPCLRCNKFIKFGMLMDIARREKAFFATGHYARVLYNKKNKNYELRKGRDLKKDQSYVLYALKQKQLSRLLLPLGDYTKELVYQEIKNLKIPFKPGKESQDICFISDGDYAGFIQRHNPSFVPIPGEIINPQGDVLGRHKGLIYYTIGQRKGLGIAFKEPLFVRGFNIAKNQVIVDINKNLGAATFLVKDLSFTDMKYDKDKFLAGVKIRYHHQPQQSVIRGINSRTAKVEFKDPQRAITPGQGAVFYKNDLVLGGGIISEVIG